MSGHCMGHPYPIERDVLYQCYREKLHQKIAILGCSPWSVSSLRWLQNPCKPFSSSWKKKINISAWKRTCACLCRPYCTVDIYSASAENIWKSQGFWNATVYHQTYNWPICIFASFPPIVFCCSNSCPRWQPLLHIHNSGFISCILPRTLHFFSALGPLH